MHIEINDHEIFRIDFMFLQRKHKIHFCYCFFFKIYHTYSNVLMEFLVFVFDPMVILNKLSVHNISMLRVCFFYFVQFYSFTFDVIHLFQYRTRVSCHKSFDTHTHT